MNVLPNYVCAIIPLLQHDPVKMTICVAEINNMRLILYWEYTDILSKHVNWYMANSLSWICEPENLFDPPADVDLVKLGM